MLIESILMTVCFDCSGDDAGTVAVGDVDGIDAGVALLLIL